MQKRGDRMIGRQISWFDEESRLERLSKLGDPLERVSKAVNFELFKPLLRQIFGKAKDPKKGGRPPWDFLLIFKIMILQELYNTADEMTEYLINDRLSFQRFLGLTLGDKVPDAKAIWAYKDALAKSGRAKALFELFNQQLDSEGVITRKGSLVDASFVDVPRQRNSREENKAIKNGDTPEGWASPEKANFREQKDTDARWAKKGVETHFGYKDHVKVDQESKIITDFSVTAASVHDSQQLVELIDEKDEVVRADSAYVGEEIQEEVRKKIRKKLGLSEEEMPKIKFVINEKGYKNNPLTQEQKENNRQKSRTRARVEHVFGHMTNSMGGIFVRTIGLAKSTMAITLKNLAYNISRYSFLSHPKTNTTTS
jgi:IS5 family transposase